LHASWRGSRRSLLRLWDPVAATEFGHVDSSVDLTWRWKVGSSTHAGWPVTVDCGRAGSSHFDFAYSALSDHLKTLQ
jgi:hypothetical protein